MLEAVRAALRIKTLDFDNEIQTLIDACTVDMAMSGVILLDDSQSTAAVILYCKAYFGYSDDSEKWLERYTAMKIAMAHSTEYAEDLGDDE